MDKGIVIDKSVIRESGPGDLIVAIDCHFHEREGKKIYPGKTDIPSIDLKDLSSCEKGLNCFQVPGSEEPICVCKIENEK